MIFMVYQDARIR